MAFVNQIPNTFAGRQLDEPVLRELTHPTNGIASAVLVNRADTGQSREGGRKHLIDRCKVAAGQLFSDDSLLLGL